VVPFFGDEPLCIQIERPDHRHFDAAPSRWNDQAIRDACGHAFNAARRRETFYATFATLGAPLEVTAADLAIERFLFVDPESAALLRELA
jgi:hypothetical protein